MPEQTLEIAIPLLIFLLAVYGVGLRPSNRFPFLRLAAPARIFAGVILSVTKSRLRKTATIRDWFVYREGHDPRPGDVAYTQNLFIINFVGILLVYFIAS
jgi:hypothetical protein